MDYSRKLVGFFLVIASANLLMLAEAGNFIQDTEQVYGEWRMQYLEGGKLMTLKMDQASGSGVQSKNEYMYGRFDMRMKLPAGNTAGTVTTFYLSSQGPHHDEIDFEFLGNTTGSPITLHTNIILHGKGGREQEFYLWFDPTQDFHLYTIVWNPHRVIWLVDNVPIRVYTNWGVKGVRFPTGQAMKMYATLWDAEDWATQGGRVKTDWSQPPFTASYRDYNADACVPPATFPCPSPSSGRRSWRNHGISAASRNMLRWVQTKYMIYNYCSDTRRFPRGLHLPRECKKPRF